MVDQNKEEKINILINNINKYLKSESWNIKDIIKEFNKILPDFNHIDAGKTLEEKM